MKTMKFALVLVAFAATGSQVEAGLFDCFCKKEPACCAPIEYCVSEPICCTPEPICSVEPTCCAPAAVHCAPVCAAPAPVCQSAPVCCEAAPMCCEPAPVCCDCYSYCPPKKECFLKRMIRCAWKAEARKNKWFADRLDMDYPYGY